MAKKEIINVLKLEIPAGKATPAPPIGPILGQNGIPIGDFVNEFNGKTQGMGNISVPVVVTVFKDRTFRMRIKQPTVVSMIKAKLNIQKGSATPNKEKIAKIKKKDLRDIAEKKLEDFNTKNVDSALNIVAGTAKSMGIEVVD